MVEIGQILSYESTPSTTKAYALLHKDIAKGSFIKIKDKDAFFFAFVNDVFRSNPYYENYVFKNKDSKSFFPVDEWHNSIAELRILAYYKEGAFLRPLTAPFPGAVLVEPSNQELIDFLGLKEKGLHLGSIEERALKINIDASKLLQKHLAVLAMSGAGKSYFLSVLIEELLEKTKLSLVLFDLHGEYKHFAKPVIDSEHKDYSNKVILQDASKIRMALDYNLICFLAKGISDAQKQALRTAFSEISTNKEVFDMKQLISHLRENKELKANVREALISKLNYVASLGIFGKSSSFNKARIKPNSLLIYDLSGITNNERKQMLVYYIASQLFYDRMKEKVPPFVIFLEEAHNFIPVADKNAIAKSMFETIAREGRKFGASLCLVSQRPVNLSTTVLSQCNTHIYLRIINPNDLKHISESSEALDKKSIDFITGLRVGEALLVGSALNYPVFFKVREKYSQDAEHSINLEEMADKYYKKENEKEKDLSLYL